MLSFPVYGKDKGTLLNWAPKLNSLSNTVESNSTVIDNSVTIQQLQTFPYVATVGGSANAITLTPDPAITAYEVGQVFTFTAASVSTGAVTIAVNGLTATTVKKLFGAAKYDLIAGDLRPNGVYNVMYDGTYFLLMNRNSIIAKTNTDQSIVNSAADTVIFTVSVLANTMSIYGKMRFTHIGRYLNATGGAQTIRWHLDLGAITLFDTGAVTMGAGVNTNQAVALHHDFSMGAATNAQRTTTVLDYTTAAFNTVQGTPGAPTSLMANRENGDRDMTSNQTLSLSIQLGAASVNLGYINQGCVLEFLT